MIKKLLWLFKKQKNPKDLKWEDYQKFLDRITAPTKRYIRGDLVIFNTYPKEKELCYYFDKKTDWILVDTHKTILPGIREKWYHFESERFKTYLRFTVLNGRVIDYGILDID